MALINRLGESTSPYLLQHADNPVAWQRWTTETLQLAIALDRPILLSVGYSACHWCHVMAHESFEDAETASVMDAHFVCVKVDREEQPDVDAFAMGACQLLTGSGGWPLHAVLDPRTLSPFFAGTYFPPEARYGRPSWREVCSELGRLWEERRGDLEGTGREVVGQLQRRQHAGGSGAVGGGASLEADAVVRQLVDAAVEQARATYDAQHGGFGGAPKFPHPGALIGLVRSWHARGGEGGTDELVMVRSTLREMLVGGMWDQLGGGWHRYSVDRRWDVPHFEKMLYDQAQLIAAHAWAWQAAPDADDLRAIGGSVGWMLAEMCDPAGGVHSTLDADSEGEEGLFYTWTPDEVREVVGEEAGALVERALAVTAEGNLERTGRSVITRRAGLTDLAGEGEGGSVAARLVEAEEALLAARGGRVRPGTDDKVLTAWNGMLLWGLCEVLVRLPAHAAPEVGPPPWPAAPEASAVLGACERLARQTVRGLLGRGTTIDGGALRTWRGSSDGGAGFLDDHAWAALGLWRWGLLDEDGAALERALRLVERTVSDFTTDEGGFVLAGASHGALPVVERDLSDGAVPAAQAVAMRCLVEVEHVLPAHSDVARWRAARRAAGEALRPTLRCAPHASWAALAALEEASLPRAVWVLRHDGLPDTSGRVAGLARRLRAAAPTHASVVTWGPDGVPDALASLFAGKQAPREGWMGWRCSGLVCDLPTSDEAALTWA